MNQKAQESITAESDCERVRRFALEYLDGELEESIIVAIRVHLEVCKPCGQRIAFEAAFLHTISRGQKPGRIPTVVEERCIALMTEWKKHLS